MSYEFAPVICFLIKNFTSKSCRDSLRASSPGNFRGWGRGEWEDRSGELARRLCREGKEMCESVGSLPRRGSSRVPAPWRRLRIAWRAKSLRRRLHRVSSCKIIAFCSFDLLVAVSVTVVVVLAPHYHYNVVRTKARKTRPKKNIKGRDEKSG